MLSEGQQYVMVLWTFILQMDMNVEDAQVVLELTCIILSVLKLSQHALPLMSIYVHVDTAKDAQPHISQIQLINPVFQSSVPIEMVDLTVMVIEKCTTGTQANASLAQSTPELKTLTQDALLTSATVTQSPPKMEIAPHARLVSCQMHQVKLVDQRLQFQVEDEGVTEQFTENLINDNHKNLNR